MLLLQNMNAPSKDTLQKWAIHFTGLTCMHFFFLLLYLSVFSFPLLCILRNFGHIALIICFECRCVHSAFNQSSQKPCLNV